MSVDNNREPERVMIELPLLKWEGPKDWKERAKCKGMDTRKFFQRWSSEKLGSLCQECPVRLVCLEFAIRNELLGGLYGGLNGVQREGMTVEDIEFR